MGNPVKHETPHPKTMTRILGGVRQRRGGATSELFQLVYAELRRLAESQMRGERRSHTLQPTALVHEAFVRLAKAKDSDWNSRAHFFAAAAEAMRRILVDHARARATVKRGGDRQKVSLAATVDLGKDRAEEVLAVDEALSRLATVDPRKSRLVELRFFAGLDTEETAAVLGVSSRTVKRDWSYAKAWLYREMCEG